MTTEKNNLKKILKRIKRNNKKIVLCHGVFDLMHLGHLYHFKSAKSYGDYLIVSITSNKYINKGPGRPIFNQHQRLEFLKQIKLIDHVVVSNTKSAEDVIKIIKPDFYVKGPDYLENSKDKTKKIFIEKKLVEKFGGKIKYTKDETFSSSSIINSGKFIFNEEQREYVKKIKLKYGYNKIYNILKKFKSLNVAVIGEIIIDKYCFGETIGKSGKEPHLVLNENFTENYPGGSAAVARHISDFVGKVNLVSPFGNEISYKKILKKSFSKNIKTFLFKPYNKFKTISKTRYVDKNSFYKLFGSYVLPNYFLNGSDKHISRLLKNNTKTDLIIICDYGHGFLNPGICKTLGKYNKFISLNAQINSANKGYHSINKYKNINSVVINEYELRQEFRDNITDIKILAKKIKKLRSFKTLIVTQGKAGAFLIDNKYKIFKCPAFAQVSVDKVGAGDAMLSLASLGLKLNLDPEIVLFLGSLASSISVQSMGNKKKISFEELDRIIEYILK